MSVRVLQMWCTSCLFIAAACEEWAGCQEQESSAAVHMSCANVVSARHVGSHGDLGSLRENLQCYSICLASLESFPRTSNQMGDIIQNRQRLLSVQSLMTFRCSRKGLCIISMLRLENLNVARIRVIHGWDGVAIPDEANCIHVGNNQRC